MATTAAKSLMSNPAAQSLMADFASKHIATQKMSAKDIRAEGKHATPSMVSKIEGMEKAVNEIEKPKQSVTNLFTGGLSLATSILFFFISWFIMSVWTIICGCYGIRTVKQCNEYELVLADADGVTPVEPEKNKVLAGLTLGIGLCMLFFEVGIIIIALVGAAFAAPAMAAGASALGSAGAAGAASMAPTDKIASLTAGIFKGSSRAVLMVTAAGIIGCLFFTSITMGISLKKFGECEVWDFGQPDSAEYIRKKGVLKDFNVALLVISIMIPFVTFIALGAKSYAEKVAYIKALEKRGVSFGRKNFKSKLKKLNFGVRRSRISFGRRRRRR